MTKKSSTRTRGNKAGLAAPMTGKEYQATLAELGISNYAFAPRVGIALRTAQNYAAGTTRIPGPLAILLRAALRHPALKAELFAPAG